jgi:hypothetical protein
MAEQQKKAFGSFLKLETGKFFVQMVWKVWMP